MSRFANRLVLPSQFRKELFPMPVIGPQESANLNNGNGAPSGLRLSQSKQKVLEQLMKGESLNSPRRPPIIKPRPRDSFIPLSYSQLQVWLHAQMNPDVPFYNENITFYRYGPVVPHILEKCLCEIVRRHEIWRTTFDLQNGEPVQIVNPVSSTFPLEVVDLRHLSETERMAEALRLATKNASTPFDLRQGPLLRALLICLADEEHRLFMTFHQLIFDGITAERIFLPELAALYEAFSKGQLSPPTEAPLQYGDFAYFQRNRQAPQGWLQDKAFWRNQLSGELAVLQWPAGHARPAVETHRGELQRFVMRNDLVERLRTFSHQQSASLYMICLAALAALLHRYSGLEDIIIGGLTAGRNQPETESLFGFFVNPVAFRFQLSGKPTFRELLHRVRSVVLESLAHAELPFIDVVREIEQKPNLDRHPLFQVMLSQQPRDAKSPDGWDWNIEEVSNGGSKMDLFMILDDQEDEIVISATHNPDLLDGKIVSMMVAHWQRLLEAAVAHPDQPIASLPLLSESERKQLVVEWNSTGVDYPKDICLHELIETQVERSPDATAVIYEDDRLNYRELNVRANQVAHYLKKLGVRPESLVGVCMERSVEMIVGLLGILKAGAAYLPLDPEYPQDRLFMMIQDSSLRVLLTQRRLANQFTTCGTKVICLDADNHMIAQESTSNPSRTATPDNVAYAIYTSGSTGRPKGVLNIHRAIVNRLLWMQDAYCLTSDDRVLQKTPYSFDVSVWEFFWPLISGAALVFARPGGHKDPDYLVALIKREKVTTAHFVPSMLQVFLEVDGLEACGSLKRVICSGEALPYEVQNRFFARMRAELHNLYGPTEAAVDVTYWQCRPESQDSIVPIGRPIANVQIYLLDKNLQPVPVGVAGELHIGGVGLARGYLNRPELTAERFIPDPFSVGKNGRLYKTGDLARYRADGSIEYLGRIDDQVKLRGFRIELGEIEAVLHEHPLVREARVVVREDIPGDRRLVGYIVCNQLTNSVGQQLREYLSQRLPHYMVPMIIALDSLPLTANGKLDRRKLPAPEIVKRDLEAQETGNEGRNSIEQVLAEVWGEVLGIEQVGNYDNFFDLGGHSLTAMQVVARVKSRLGLQIKPRELAFQTLAQLAAVCKEQLHSNANA